jgi:ribosomal protein S18 acetylase RimI-like enzyme
MLIAIIFILFIILILIICFIICNSAQSSIYSIGGNKDDIKSSLTYCIIGEDSGLDYSQLRLILNSSQSISNNKIAFVEVPKDTKSVHLSIGGFDEKSYLEKKKSAYNPLFLSQHATLKNLLDKHRMLTDKTQLYTTMQNYYPSGLKYLPKTISPEEYNNGIYVLKKQNAGRQMGIYMVSSKADLSLGLKKLSGVNNRSGANTESRIPTNEYILSEYINNPLLLNGKKFHIRTYFLLYIRWGITYCVAFDEYRPCCAIDDYKQSDYSNTRIHISGFIEELRYTDAYSYNIDINTILNKESMLSFEDCKKHVCNAMAAVGMRPFEEADSGYHLFGADIMITDDNKAYLLEINRRPGLLPYGNKAGWSEYNKNFSYKLFSFIAKHVIFPHFGLSRCIRPKGILSMMANGFHSSLASFSKIFIGEHLELLPIEIVDAQDIQYAHKIHFYNLLSFHKLLEFTKCIWLVYKNDTVIGYAGLKTESGLKTELGLKPHDTSIMIGISPEFQRRNIATAVVALIIEIYASRVYPKNPYIYFPVIKNKHFFSKVDHPINKICKRLNFNIENNRYFRLCKVNSPKNNILFDTKLYISSEFDLSNLDINNFFIQKKLYPFVHLSLGVAHDSYEHFLSTGTNYSHNFLKQGAELKNIFKIDGNIFAKQNLVNLSNAVKFAALPISHFKSLNELQSHCANNIMRLNADHFIIDGQIVSNTRKLHINNLSQLSEFDYIIKMQQNPLLLNKKKIKTMTNIFVYVVDNNEKFNKLNLSALNNEKNSNIKYYIQKTIIKTTKAPYAHSDFFNEKIHILSELSDIEFDSITDKIDMDLFHNNINAAIDIILNANISLYAEQNAGFRIFGVFMDYSLDNISRKAIPIIEEIFNINVLEHHLKYAFDMIIFPHFGIPSITHMDNLHLQMGKKINTFDIFKMDKKIGHIEIDIIGTEINLLSIEIDNIERPYAINAVIQLMQILSARYAPINPTILIDAKLNVIYKSIIKKLNFVKQNNVFKRPCRVIFS